MASDGRLRRFLHLERARPSGPTAEPRDRPAATGERIAGVEQAREGRQPPGDAPRTRTGARLERFGPAPEPAIELLETEGRRPFTRCCRCAMDNNILATTCQACGVSLDTPEQHEFDERFWVQRQADMERERRQEAELQELRARTEAEEARARRAMAETLAREVGEAERRRLDGWGGWGGGGWHGRSSRFSPFGMKLVRWLVADDRWHLPAFAGLALAGLLLVLAGALAHSLFLAVVGVAGLIVLLANTGE